MRTLSFFTLNGNKVVEIGFFRMGSVKFALSEWRKRSGMCPVTLISFAFLVSCGVTGFS